MVIVPLAGDKISVQGAQKTAVSFSPYRNQPTIYVETDGPDAEAVPFSDIEAINGIKVTAADGIFKVPGRFRRAHHLPQPDDAVTFEGGLTFVVDRIKLLKSELASGLFVEGKDSSGKQQRARLADVKTIKRSHGSQDFNLSSFKKLYSEYLGAAT